MFAVITTIIVTRNNRDFKNNLSPVLKLKLTFTYLLLILDLFFFFFPEQKDLLTNVLKGLLHVTNKKINTRK